jgi:thiol-disulfide isomerase/thioredoxin
MRRVFTTILSLLPLLQLNINPAYSFIAQNADNVYYNARATDTTTKNGIQFNNGTWNEILALAKKENKPIFIDCFTVWCGPCTTMSSTVFMDQAVADYFNATFINAKIDMEKGEGIDIKEKYEVSAFPTFLYLDNDGNVINRMVGSMPASEFIAKAKSGLSETGLAKMRDKYVKGERSSSFVLDYLAVLEKAYLQKEAQTVAVEFFKNLMPEDYYLLKSKTYWNLFEKFEDDVNSTVFNYVYSNRADFYKLYKEKAVEKKFQAAWSSGSKGFIKKESDPEKIGSDVVMLDRKGFNNYVKLMEKHDVKDWKDIVFNAKVYNAEQLNDWCEYVRLIGSKIKAQTPKNISEIELYNWGLVIDKNCKEEKLRNKAADWFIKMIPIIAEREKEARLKDNGSKAGEYKIVSMVNCQKEFKRLVDTLSVK